MPSVYHLASSSGPGQTSTGEVAGAGYRHFQGPMMPKMVSVKLVRSILWGRLFEMGRKIIAITQEQFMGLKILQELFDSFKKTGQRHSLKVRRESYLSLTMLARLLRRLLLGMRDDVGMRRIGLGLARAG